MNFLGNRLTGSRGSVVKAAAAMAVLALEPRALQMGEYWSASA